MQTQSDIIDNIRNKALLELIRQGLEIGNNKNTNKMLGNRVEYIGLSDVSRYCECPRAALADKLFPFPTTLNSLITVQRGHWHEQGIAGIFTNLGLRYLAQLEISYPDCNLPLRGHLDFTLIWEKPYPAIRIVEVKSTNKLPLQPYEAHIIQAQGQVNLLCQLWNKPVFSLRNATGEVEQENITFKDLCHKQMGICISNEPDKISVESWLLYISMQDATCFGPYAWQKDQMTHLLATARDMWEQFQIVGKNSSQLAHMPYAKDYHPLCNHCNVSADCPKFVSNVHTEEWNDTLAHLMELKDHKSALEEEIRDIESILKLAAENTDAWLDGKEYRFRLTHVAGRKMLDKDLLRTEIDDIFRRAGMDDITAAQLIENCERLSAPSTRLQIVPVK